MKTKLLIINYLKVKVFNDNIKNPKTLIKDICLLFDISDTFVVYCIMKFEKEIICNLLENDKEIIDNSLLHSELDYHYHQAFIKNFDLIKLKLKLS